MDSQSLQYSLEHVAGSGYKLNIEQQAALQTSILIMKKNYKFQRVLFWGKILSLKEEYFIAQGRGEDEMQDKRNLYSFNCIDWLLLPPITEDMMKAVSVAAKGRFRGDPSYVYEHLESKVSEENRLAVVIHQIDEEASVVPRGAFIRDLRGLVQVNRSFAGLSPSEATRLSNFLHFRKPKNQKKRRILEMADLNPAIDFLDVVSDDVPKGSWSLQLEGAGQVCILRSLLWPGLTLYHVLMTPQHGYIYIGSGMKNLDLPFML
ncbi:radial spoke head protein 9 homolog isoform X1 [Takifugu flavidus]|uniref:radial spoke head protein 9 homolog isoform X1 n=1 Tax=Takifugu flavidus TaxID=433684 RepID=UPI0025449B0A|nr:radial spoke head protein 9 homolog isoform X1 [Takifugu flavidus]